MKYFKLAYNIFANKLLLNILAIVEIAAILVLTNTVVATHNSKKMLYAPYEELLSQKGVAFSVYGPEDIYLLSDEEIIKILDSHNGNMDYGELMEVFKKNLKGDVDITYTYRALIEGGDAPRVLIKLPHSEISRGFGLYYIDHDIFSKMRMPLQAGRWPSSEKTKNDEIEIVISGGTDAQLNQVYNTERGKMKVVGILTESTYIPPADRNYGNMDHPLSLFDLYQSYDPSVATTLPFALTDQNLLNPDDEIVFIPEGLWFISFGQSLSDEDFQSNIEYLSKYGTISGIDKPDTFSSIDAQSQQDMRDVYLRMLPIVLAAAIVVMSGLIGSIAIAAIRQKKNFSIYFLCGCRWKDCTKIMLAYLSILFALAAVLTVLAIVVMKFMNMDALIGSVYGWNNVLFTVLEIAVMYLLAMILPHRIIKSSSPVESLKSA